MSDKAVWVILVILAYLTGCMHGFFARYLTDKIDKEVLRFSWECLKRDILGIVRK